MTHVKICGVTSVQDVELCVALGVDAIGLNFAPGSPRCLTLEAALPLSEPAGDLSELRGRTAVASG